MATDEGGDEAVQRKSRITAQRRTEAPPHTHTAGNCRQSQFKLDQIEKHEEGYHYMTVTLEDSESDDEDLIHSDLDDGADYLNAWMEDDDDDEDDEEEDEEEEGDDDDEVHSPGPSASVTALPPPSQRGRSGRWSAAVCQPDEVEDEDNEDDEDYTPGPSMKSASPMKRLRRESAAWRASQEEDRWHSREERDTRPDPLKFLPAREPGPTLDAAASWSPLSLFQLFFSTSVVRTIIANTNANAAKRLQAGLKFVWKPLTVSDFYVFLAVVLFSGLVKVHDTGDYWRKEWPYNFRFPGDRMTRDRFESILWSLHLSNPAEDEANDRKKNTTEYDRLFKIKPLYTEMVNACKTHFQPYQNIAIDERMVASKARLSLKHKWGYKLFVLADSSTAYTWNFSICEGKKSVHVPGRGLSHASVMDLMAFPLLGRGYTLFVDDFYSSPALFEELSRQNTGACGTIRTHLTDFPRTKRNDLPKNAESGDMRWIRQDKLLFVKWMDVREVAVCSTVHEAFSGQTVKRRVKEAGVWQTKNVTIPDPVLDYNHSMGGVDLSNALIGSYSVHHKTMKWYKTFFYHFMDIAVVNSFLLHKELCKKKKDPSMKRPLTQKRFREKLAAEMLDFAKSSAPPPPPSSASCMPAYYGDNGTKSRRYCRRCQDAGMKRVKTPVYCTRCRVPLCCTPKRNCFKDWHSR